MVGNTGRHSAEPAFLLAVAVPLAILAGAYALWVISDRAVYIGPLDKAAFGWTVVIPLSWLAPGVAGLAWSSMGVHRRLLAALFVGLPIAAVTGAFLANAIEQVGCTPVTSWTDDLPGSLAVGIVFAAGTSLGGLLAAWVADRTTGVWRQIATVATGGLIAAGGFFGALMTWVVIFPPLGCRPVMI